MWWTAAFPPMSYFERQSCSQEDGTPANKAISLPMFELPFIMQQWLLNLPVIDFSSFFIQKKIF